MQRRNFLNILPAAALLMGMKNSKKRKLPISCNNYNWVTFFKREGKAWGKDMAYDIAEFAKCGIPAIEPNIESVAMGKQLIPLLKQYNIAMPSIYVNSILHEKDQITTSTQLILDIADLVKSYGTSIIVTNPSPITWGGEEIKTDEQLKLQAVALDRLGAALRKKGITLAYHTHDMEMKAGAREFHHMLQRSSPRNVSFCFDMHWVYRGSANSEVAVFDILKMYGDRIVELHIRQSEDGIWKEAFSAEGDINFKHFVNELKSMKISPHLVIEQCIEAETPHTMDAIAAHKKDLLAIRTTFGELI